MTMIALIYLATLYIIWAHFVGDFVLQSDRMATRKSKDSWILTQHCLIYCLPFMLLGWQFALLNAGLHFCVDYVTSRLTSYYWQKEERHAFFVVIGMDQAIHMIFLFTTLFIMKGLTTL